VMRWRSGASAPREEPASTYDTRGFTTNPLTKRRRPLWNDDTSASTCTVAGQ
jgi:hypothetical protein